MIIVTALEKVPVTALGNGSGTLYLATVKGSFLAKEEINFMPLSFSFISMVCVIMGFLLGWEVL